MIRKSCQEDPKSSQLDITPTLSVRCTESLGDIICLLPVFESLYQGGYRINIVTSRKWIHAFSVLRPDFFWKDGPTNDVIDLNELADCISPGEHHGDELARRLGVGRPFPSPRLKVPEVWSRPFDNLKNSVVVALDGPRKSHHWPAEQASMLRNFIKNERLVLVGTGSDPAIPCDFDLRDRLELHELFGLLAVSGAILTTHYNLLQLAAALGTPCAALLGGNEPAYQVRPDQHVVVIQPVMDCCPCHNIEQCTLEHRCIRDVQAEDVAEAIKLAKNINHRFIYKVAANSNN